MRRLVLAFGALVSTMGMAVAADGAYRAAAENWLSLVDHGHYADSCAQASAYFRSAITEAAWVQAVKAAREPLGTLTVRDPHAATAATTLPGAPDGEYEVLQFRSSFANKAAAVETVTLKREGDAWKVAGYFIK
jgi:hypothetical protein